MDGLKSWALTVCFAALAAGIAGIISPTGKLEKSYKFALAIFLLCCILTPVFGLRHIHFSASLPQTGTAAVDTRGLDSIVEKQEETQAEQNVKKLVQSSCAEKGITPLGIDAVVQKTSAGFSVKSVTVTLRHADIGASSGIKTAINQKLGIQAAVEDGGN